MRLTNQNDFNKYRLVKIYCILFYVLMLYNWFNGLFLSQINPAFFHLRQDFFTWIFMFTGLHKIFLNNFYASVVFDFLFYSMPLLYLIILKKKPAYSLVVACIMIIINWAYVQCYTLYPTNSIEAHIAWLLFPFVFLSRSNNVTRSLLDGLRYFFIFFFFSSGVWKIYQGGFFNTFQMAAILLEQHKELLTNSPGYWQTKMQYWLIRNFKVSYTLYLIAAGIELSFVIGFFTKKYDSLFISAFLIFLVFDYLIMRISYVEILPLLIPMYMNLNIHFPDQRKMTNVQFR